MKKKLLSLSLCLCLALSMVVTAYAVDTDPAISDEQYQRYLEIAERVSEERGIELTLSSASEMDKVYTDEEYEAEMQEFCDVIDSIRNENLIMPFSNPSSGGEGVKSLEVNASKNLEAGYFLWTLRGSINVKPEQGRFAYATNGSIDYISPQRYPSGYSSILSGASTYMPSLSTSTQKVVQRSVKITRNGSATSTTVTFQARFVLNQATGVVTMNGKAL